MAAERKEKVQDIVMAIIEGSDGRWVGDSDREAQGEAGTESGEGSPTFSLTCS